MWESRPSSSLRCSQIAGRYVSLLWIFYRIVTSAWPGLHWTVASLRVQMTRTVPTPRQERLLIPPSISALRLEAMFLGSHEAHIRSARTVVCID